MRVWSHLFGRWVFLCAIFVHLQFSSWESDHEICINTWTPRWQLLTAADVPAGSAAVAAAGVRRCRPRGGISAAVLHCARQQGLGLQLGRGGGGLTQIRWVEDTSSDPTNNPIEISTLLSKDIHLYAYGWLKNSSKGNSLSIKILRTSVLIKQRQLVETPLLEKIFDRFFRNFQQGEGLVARRLLQIISIYHICNVSMSNWGPLLMPCCVCRAVRGGAARLLRRPGCLLHLRAEKFSRARTQGS